MLKTTTICEKSRLFLTADVTVVTKTGVLIDAYRLTSLDNHDWVGRYTHPIQKKIVLKTFLSKNNFSISTRNSKCSFHAFKDFKTKDYLQKQYKISFETFQWNFSYGHVKIYPEHNLHRGHHLHLLR